MCCFARGITDCAGLLGMACRVPTVKVPVASGSCTASNAPGAVAGCDCRWVGAYLPGWLHGSALEAAHTAVDKLALVGLGCCWLNVSQPARLTVEHQLPAQISAACKGRCAGPVPDQVGGLHTLCMARAGSSEALLSGVKPLFQLLMRVFKTLIGFAHGTRRQLRGAAVGREAAVPAPHARFKP